MLCVLQDQISSWVGVEQRWVLGAPWSASPAKTVTSELTERPCLREGQGRKAIEEHTLTSILGVHRGTRVDKDKHPISLQFFSSVING